MGIIAKPNTFSANTSISSSQVNANFDTIYNDYNGGIAAANLASNAVSTPKIADSAVTTDKINDSAVTAAKINFGGSGTGVWWQEIARTTLSSAGDTLTVSSIPARKYLMVVASLLDTGGTVSVSLRLNSDTGSNYAARGSTDGAADVGATSQTSVGLTVTGAFPHMVTLEVLNIASKEKIFYGRVVSANTAGAGTTPGRIEVAGKWSNTSDQISALSLINGGTGDYAIGSQAIVLGHD